LRVFALAPTMARMEEHAPQEEPSQRLSLARVALGSLVAVLFAAATVVAAILSFDLNPVGPVVVAVATIGGGSYAARRVDDPAFKAAAIGLVIGGLAAVLLWPLFSVDSPTIQ
jgi:hypothetical protein